MKQFTDRTAIVTGAGRGIGRAIAERLGAEGARVALVSRSEEQLDTAAAAIRRAGGIAFPAPADVTDREQVREMVRRVEVELGPVDFLVNNAGSFYTIGPVWEVDPEAWWRDVTINLNGVFLCCREALPRMVARNAGRVINLIGGGTGTPFPHGSGYGSSKAAVMRLTECLAEELRQADSAVTVFAVGPGLVRTALTEFQLDSEEGRKWMGRIEQMFADGKDVPPTRAAALTSELLSGRFDRLSGRAFSIGDDLDEVLARQDEILRKDQKTLRFRT